MGNIGRQLAVVSDIRLDQGVRCHVLCLLAGDD